MFKAIQVTFVVEIFLTGCGHLTILILPPPAHGSIADIGLGVVLLAIAAALLRLWNWLRFVPKSGTSRVYFELVYSILLTWFIICSSWEEAFRYDVYVLPFNLTSQVRHALMLCAMPPLVGMSVDLLIGKWLDKQYRPMGIFASGVLISAVILVVGVYFVSR